MSAPAPLVPLAFQTTALYGNTLFSFQPNAFQSIELSQGAKWSQLPMGVSVNGSQAVVAKSGGQDCLFVVGGRTNASAASFPGFQRYTFGTKSWQQLSPSNSVVQNRVQHGAVYLPSTSSILVFGGSQDNSYKPTSQTYTISANEPFSMKSWPAGAPAVQNPILMPYNASHALLAGGGASQSQIWTFSEADGWVMMTTTIPGGIADASKVKGAVVSDASGNKQLELFDMYSSPNAVRTIALSNKFTKRAEPESTITQRDDSSAPTASRNGFDLAQSNDKVVLTGGTNDKAAGSVVVFDQAKNQFASPQAVFGNSVGTSADAPTAGSGSSAGSGSGSSSGSNGGPQVNQLSNAPGGTAGGAAAAAPSGAAPAATSVPAAAASSGGPPASSAAPPASSGSPPSSAASPASSAASVASGASSAPVSVTASSSASNSGSASASASASASSAKTSATGAASSASAAAAAAAASSSSSPPTGASSDSTTVILGAVLGSFFGIAAIFLIAWLIVRYRRNKARQTQDREAALNEKRSDSPASSIGSITGKRSPFENGQQPMISRPTLQPQNQAEDLASPRDLANGDDLAPPRPLNNDEGWSRYFANNNTVENLYPGSNEPGHGGSLAAGAAAGAAAGFGAAALAHSGPRDTRYTSNSEYTMASPTSSRNPHESALVVPPLNAGGSYGHSRGLSRDTIPEDASYTSPSQQGWDPTSSHSETFPSSPDVNRPVRPASSIYYDRASSIYPPNPLSPGAMENYPPMPMLPPAGTFDQDKGMRSIISKDFADPISPGNFAFPESVARRVGPGSEPRSAGNATGRKHESADLSWLQMQN